MPSIKQTGFQLGSRPTQAGESMRFWGNGERSGNLTRSSSPRHQRLIGHGRWEKGFSKYPTSCDPRKTRCAVYNDLDLYQSHPRRGNVRWNNLAAHPVLIKQRQSSSYRASTHKSERLALASAGQHKYRPAGLIKLFQHHYTSR